MNSTTPSPCRTLNDKAVKSYQESSSGQYYLGYIFVNAVRMVKEVRLPANIIVDRSWCDEVVEMKPSRRAR